MSRTPFEADLIGWIIENEIWGEEISEDLFPIMEKHGLCKKIPFDPDQHINIEGAEVMDENDLIWWFSSPEDE